LRQDEINQGNASQAKRYGQRIAKELGFTGDQPPENLSGLLAWAGYAAFKAEDIQRLDSQSLMDYERLAAAVSNPQEFRAAFPADSWDADNLLATRFFAPKTTDASGQENPTRLSWRKLVRLKIRPDSTADEAGIIRMYLVGNVYTADLEQSPFDKESKNNQVILVRKHATPEIKSLAYWLVYGSLSTGAKLTQYSETSWDAIDPKNDEGPLQKDPIKKYHVPDACIQCHGLQPETAMLSYLDSDYWLDRSLDDFPQVNRSRWGVLFDAGKDASSPRYKEAMQVLRKLNREIFDQNRHADPQAFQARAAANWLRVHETEDGHLPDFRRSIPSADGKTAWNERNATDQQLLPLLNRYCFRCHSNLYYHVFDKAAVVERIDMMVSFLQDGYMPRDRRRGAR
jgi:hypothetical protein